jgi:hypothetical protein
MLGRVIADVLAAAVDFGQCLWTPVKCDTENYRNLLLVVHVIFNGNYPRRMFPRENIFHFANAVSLRQHYKALVLPLYDRSLLHGEQVRKPSLNF